MRIRQVRWLTTSVLILATATVASANQKIWEPPPGEAWIISRFVAPTGHSIENVRKQLQKTFHESDVDGGGVSATDYQLSETVAKAKTRAAVVKQHLEMDLDGDLAVTHAELKVGLTSQARRPLLGGGGQVMPTEAQQAQILKKLLEGKLRADANKDGKLTIAEAVAQSERFSSGWFGSRFLVPMSLDADKNGTVSLDEFDAAASRVIGKLDPNADGKVAADEAVAFHAVQAKVFMSIADDSLLELQKVKRQAVEKIITCAEAKPADKKASYDSKTADCAPSKK